MSNLIFLTCLLLSFNFMPLLFSLRLNMNIPTANQNLTNKNKTIPSNNTNLTLKISSENQLPLDIRNHTIKHDLMNFVNTLIEKVEEPSVDENEEFEMEALGFENVFKAFTRIF